MENQNTVKSVTKSAPECTSRGSGAQAAQSWSTNPDLRHVITWMGRSIAPMRMPRHIPIAAAALLGVAATGIGAFGAQRGQEPPSDVRSEEIIANQATGRVYVLVVKDAI